MKIQRWDRNEIKRIENVLAKRKALLADVDAEVERLRSRRKSAVTNAELKLAAAKDRAARRAKSEAVTV